MANTIRIKRRATGSAGAPTSLQNAELAFNEVDNTLYYGKGTGGAGGTATTVEPIGGTGTFVDKTSTQTISGAKTFSSTITGSVSGNAATADALSSGFNIDLTGDATGTVTGVDGSSNVSITVTVADDSHNHLASNIDDFDTQVRTNRLDQLATPTGAVAMGGQKLSGLGTPVNDGDAANKGYVDGVKQALDIKESVKVATTANITLSGTQTIDGQAVSAGDRVLVKDQTDAATNGIYVCAAGGWARADDFGTTVDASTGSFAFVEAGTVNAGNGFVLTTTGHTLGSNNLVFTQFSGAGQITAGGGLTKSGNTIQAVGTADQITVAADAISIATTYAGQSSITTLGTIATGTWQATAVGAAYGGTGKTTLTSNGILYGNGTGAVGVTAAGANSAILQSNNGTPTWVTTLDGGTF
jgi:hypothetical protein